MFSVARIGGRTLAGLLGVGTALAAAPSAYLAVLSAAGFPAGRPTPPGDRTTRFVVMVPAHDEALGIGATLESLRSLDYPTDGFAVHVVADNCSDDTAVVVRDHGWVAHERRAPDDPGKGSALNWLLERLANERFDAIVVVDADTVVDPNFLTAADRAIAAGADVAQGQYSVREPDASAASSFRYAALACRHHLRAQGRCRLSASCGLYGNGMVFRRSVLEDRRWSNHLVEDAELQNELLLDGHLVTYLPDAIVLAEMPDTTGAAATQNERWERGRLEVARRYVPRLLARIAGDRSHRVARADAVADHLVPPLSALVGIQAAVTAASAVGAFAGHRRSRRRAFIGLASIGVVGAHALAGLASVGADRHHFTALLSAPRQIIWKIRLWVGVSRPGADITWQRTQRNAGAAA